jgi:nucleotide-binding universal stress UspA family protein
MYRKVLVLLDGSRLAESVLVQAKALVSGCHVPQMVLLDVIEPFKEQPYRKGDDWIARMQKEAAAFALNYLNSLVEKLRTEGVTAEAVVIEGDPSQMIMDYAQKNGVDLIIMSTHGRSGVSRWVFGSVADKIVHNSPIPVLIIPMAGRTKQLS